MKIIFLILGLFVKNVFASGPTIALISYPEQVIAGNEFNVYFKVEEGEVNTNYYVKVNIGQDSPLVDGQTYNSSTSDWLYFNSAWTNFPKVTTDESGNFTGQVPARAKLTSAIGTSSIQASILKEGESSDKHLNSSSGAISILPAPTATPTPSPIPTATKIPTQTLVSTPTSPPTPSSPPKLTATPAPKPSLASSRLTPVVLASETTPSPLPQTAIAKQQALLIPSPPATKQSFNFLPFLTIGAGLLLLTVSVGFGILKK
jgi:hypothetical protein